MKQGKKKRIFGETTVNFAIPKNLVFGSDGVIPEQQENVGVKTTQIIYTEVENKLQKSKIKSLVKNTPQDKVVCLLQFGTYVIIPIKDIMQNTEEEPPSTVREFDECARNLCLAKLLINELMFAGGMENKDLCGKIKPDVHGMIRISDKVSGIGVIISSHAFNELKKIHGRMFIHIAREVFLKDYDATKIIHMHVDKKYIYDTYGVHDKTIKREHRKPSTYTKEKAQTSKKGGQYIKMEHDEQQQDNHKCEHPGCKTIIELSTVPKGSVQENCIHRTQPLYRCSKHIDIFAKRCTECSECYLIGLGETESSPTIGICKWCYEQGKEEEENKLLVIENSKVGDLEDMIVVKDAEDTNKQSDRKRIEKLENAMKIASELAPKKDTTISNGNRNIKGKNNERKKSLRDFKEFVKNIRTWYNKTGGVGNELDRPLWIDETLDTVLDNSSIPHHTVGFLIEFIKDFLDVRFDIHKGDAPSRIEATVIRNHPRSEIAAMDGRGKGKRSWQPTMIISIMKHDNQVIEDMIVLVSTLHMLYNFDRMVVVGTLIKGGFIGKGAHKVNSKAFNNIVRKLHHCFSTILRAVMAQVTISRKRKRDQMEESTSNALNSSEEETAIEEDELTQVLNINQSDMLNNEIPEMTDIVHNTTESPIDIVITKKAKKPKKPKKKKKASIKHITEVKQPSPKKVKKKTKTSKPSKKPAVIDIVDNAPVHIINPRPTKRRKINVPEVVQKVLKDVLSLNDLELLAFDSIYSKQVSNNIIGFSI